ncbi:DgyrCDS8205 [Dimorphilus gyrociliatus]|uniref:DgyrCDS8205 n=1 Tax=Dimorphilus gyrociliatus TaxID=2664684 RepID=A0A7I8VTG1_9ANNE|nr:DgyrCDS8205 [Dimorphilus gyrociliatus]
MCRSKIIYKIFGLDSTLYRPNEPSKFPTADFKYFRMHKTQVAKENPRILFSDNVKNWLVPSICGGLSWGMLHASLAPLDFLKCRKQVINSSHIYEGTMKLDSLRSTFRGLNPTLLGYSIQGIGKIVLFDFFKSYYSQPTSLGTGNGFIVCIASSLTAEFYTCISLCPFESVKMKFYFQPDWAKLSVYKAMTRIVKEEGLVGLYRGLWRGILPRVLMVSVIVAVQMVINESIKTYLKSHKTEQY